MLLSPLRVLLSRPSDAARPALSTPVSYTVIMKPLDMFTGLWHP